MAGRICGYRYAEAARRLLLEDVISARDMSAKERAVYEKGA